ncbi:MAG: hypothetical protein LBP54_07305 [Campylobacteraceae bacterium]|jgi:hypothetical protein|nr:hypothetical protein [Campylobacteraceae bacterium]
MKHKFTDVSSSVAIVGLIKPLFFVLTVFVLSGCASHTSNTLKNALLEGKSIVIVPTPITYDRYVYWSRDKDTTKGYFLHGYEAGYGYRAIIMDAGTYYVRKIGFADESAKNIAGNGGYISDIGHVKIIKTPEKSTKREYAKNGKIVEKTVDIESYYVIYDYVFDYDAIGFITIEPHEVVLAPYVSMDADIAEDSCIVINNKEKPFLLQMLESGKKTLLGKIWDATGTSNGFETWEWKCPIKAFFVTIETKNINDFLARADKEIFTDDMLKSIRTRVFEFGKALKKAQKLELLIPSIEQYEIKSFSD